MPRDGGNRGGYGFAMTSPDPYAADLAAIARIDAVPQILDVVCRLTGMGFAAVARVTEDRWIACAVRDEIAFGLAPGGELAIETTICNEIRDSGQGVVIDHVDGNPAWRTHHTPLKYGFQSYISLPIVRADGSFFGTLCAIDPKPHALDRPETIGMFKLFADLVAFHLDAQARLNLSETALAGEREGSELREQFIAVLGHDLRNPLASVDGGIRLLRKETLSPRGASVLDLMHQSVSRMAGLIDNVLDFARGRLGGGLPLERKAGVALGPVIEQVVGELRMAWPARRIEAETALTATVRCDPGRIGQLLSNLIANALAHGAPDEAVRVRAATADGLLMLSVANAGNPIAPEVLERLFQPFFRVVRKTGQEGLGLGLYISQQIVAAHDGTLEARSIDGETIFTARIPLA
jgi:signal transduction histidine kinase